MVTVWWVTMVSMDVPLGASTGVWEGRFCMLEVHIEKRLACFPSPGGMSLTKLSLAGNN
jgi:hypothetical protein